MRIDHQGGFSHDTRMTYREAIYSNLVESAQALAAALRKFEIEPIEPSNIVSSSDVGSLVPFFDPIPCSERWNKCWNIISMRSYSHRHAHPLLPSPVNLPRLYAVSGKIQLFLDS